MSITRNNNESDERKRIAILSGGGNQSPGVNAASPTKIARNNIKYA